jgi:hypothetical protein
MSRLVDWIQENRDWLFSGLLVAVPLAILSWRLRSRATRSQRQRGGDGSVNLQAGRDIVTDRARDERDEP